MDVGDGALAVVVWLALAAVGLAAALLALRLLLGATRRRSGEVRTPFQDETGATIWYPPPLQQVSPVDFVLTRPFTYEARDGRTWRIDDHVLGSTDYASIPWFLRWFISRYGAHSLAAVMHDQLVDTDDVERRAADRYFNEALDDLGVPPLRRNLMWSAVTLRTRFSPGANRRFAAMLAWALLAVAGVTTLVVGLASGPWWLVPAALAAPAPAALLWGDDRWNGVVAGYGLVLLAPASLAVVLTYGAYWLADPASKTEMSPSEL